MNYKNIIKSQSLRFKILRLSKFVPDEKMIKSQYKIKLGRKLNLKRPMRFTEKLQWYKLNYRVDLMTIASDKYLVREYVKSKGLEHILNKLYGVYENAEEINLLTIPNKFVLKTTNGSGTNYFCTNKSEFDLLTVKNEINNWLDRDMFNLGREWAYKKIKPRIIVEELLEDKFNNFSGINDYKFLCFNGVVKYIILDVDRNVGHKRNIYDVNWNFLDISTDYPNFGDYMKKPEGLNEMVKVASKLSKDFPFVRVDLYWVNDRVYFGELTFYPWTGYVQFTPDSFDFILGEEFKLPSIV